MISKKELQIAKAMFRKSLKEGTVDAGAVKSALKEIAGQKLAHPKRVLKTYMRLIVAAIAKEEVIVESATKIASLKEFEREIKSKTGVKKIVYKTNPQIIIGARVTHGDWIYDNTLDAKLKQVISN